MFAITLKFLEAVQRNNNTERFHANYDLYQQERKRFQKCIDQFLETAKLLNPARADLQSKSCIFRFNRDIRYRADKRPYKDHFGCELAYEGKRSGYPCFYFELRPGNSFIGIGTRRASPHLEHQMRKHAILNFNQRKKLQSWSEFKSLFGSMMSGGGEKENFIGSYKSMYALKKAFPDWDTNIHHLSKERKALRTAKCSYQKALDIIKILPKKDQKYYHQLCFIKDRLRQIPVEDEILLGTWTWEFLKKALTVAMPMLNFLQKGSEIWE